MNTSSTAHTVTRHLGDQGERIYSLPVQVFPSLVANVYLVIHDDYTALIDTGSGSARSNEQLLAGFEQVRCQWGERITWQDLSRIIITHAHVDHHGGLDFVRARSNAPVAVHELDQRVLANYRERFVLTRRAVATFLTQAGVSRERYDTMMDMYGSGKSTFVGGRAATILRDGDVLDDRFEVHHTPGHCPGQVCLRLGSVLFSADHILARTSPHLAPESITPGTGLYHYLRSLRDINALSDVRLTLGGHEAPIENLSARIQRTLESHERKLQRVLETCEEPSTIDEITQRLYPNTSGYDVLLALQKIGAHVEYLNQHDQLFVANLDRVSVDETTPPRYQRSR